jgi:hypothetical protein
MAKAQENIAQRSLRGAFEGITLQRSETGALTVDVSALNGVNVTVITNGNGRVMKLTPVEEQANAQGHDEGVINASVDKRAYNVGDVLPDGWIVGPVSPTTSKPIAIEPVAGALEGYQTWYKGEDHAKELRGQGHAGARQPDADELSALYNGVVKAGRNQNARFNTSGSVPYGGYWSSTPHRYVPGFARMQYFDAGYRFWHFKGGASAQVRLVKDLENITLLGDDGKILYQPPAP